jgi:hypothetical protein
LKNSTIIKNTAKCFVKEYPWFYMPASGPKILVHAADFVSGVILPIRLLSEEALESRKKDSSTSEEVTREKYLGHKRIKMFSFTSGFLGSTYLEFEKTV